MATPEEIAVVVTAEDFTTASGDLVPSVSQAEMAKYAQIRQRFSRSTADGDADEQGPSNIDTKGKGKATLTTPDASITPSQALTRLLAAAATHSSNAAPAAVTGDSQG
jgi:hypothetical protein